jgi:DNA-binding transcriptional LysR family regulator
MTLVQLRHLISLAETASFTRSAEALFLTQPALSRSIRTLEEELGQKLFDRIGRRSELTHFGHDVLQRARQLVFDADELSAAGGRRHGGRSGTLRVGLGAGPGALLTRPLLTSLAQRGAPIRVDILRGDGDRLLQALRARQVDAAVLEARWFRPAPDLRVEPLAEMRGGFMCRRGHPLARKRGPIGFDAVRLYPIASTQLGNDVMRAMVEAYGPQGHPDECVSLRCSELSSLVEVVRDSDAVLLAIRAAAPDLVQLNVEPAIATGAHFGLVTLAGRTEPPGLSILRELIATRLHD